MASSFFDRIDQLKEAVGEGPLTGKVEVDQVYAHYQEDGPWEHPRGGEQYALRNSLLEGSDDRMQHLADHLLTEDGSDIRGGMIDVTEEVADRYAVKAPREFGDLEDSAHPTVDDDGANIYDRPPRVHRLSEEELKLKHRGIDHLDPNHGPRSRLGRK